MPRDRIDDVGGRDDRDRRDLPPRDDFGQADFSTDYTYDPERRTAYRTPEEDARRADDYGQADYSKDYAYDPERGHGYRRFSDDDRYPARPVEADPDRGYGRRMDGGDYRPGDPRGRSWMDRAGAFFSAREDVAPRRRRGPSDRVLWTVIVERLEAERSLDLRDLEVLVENAEVTLNGAVRRKVDKRRIEDIVDIEGVRHVQNNLRVRDGRWF